MKKKTKKLVSAAAVAAISASLLIGGTLAYLSDTETVTNTFTVGNVSIEAVEPNYPGNGSDEVTNISALDEIQKDPQVTNTGTSNAVVFTRVNIPMEVVVTARADGNLLNDGNAVLTELLEFKVSDDSNGTSTGVMPYTGSSSNDSVITTQNEYDSYIDSSGNVVYYDSAYNSYNQSWIYLEKTWFYINSDQEEVEIEEPVSTVNSNGTTVTAVEVESGNTVTLIYNSQMNVSGTTGIMTKELAASTDNPELYGIYASYLWGYGEVIEPGETTESLFDVVRLVNIVEGAIDGSVVSNTTENMIITTYAIQADNIYGITSGDYDDDLDADTLMEIYEVYINQNGEDLDGSESENADSNNNLTASSTTMSIIASVDSSYLIFNSGDSSDLSTTLTAILNYTGTGTTPTEVTVTSSNSNVVSVSSSTATLTETDTDADISESEYLSQNTITSQMSGTVTLTAVHTGEATISVSAVNPDNNKTVTATLTVYVVDWNSDNTFIASSDTEDSKLLITTSDANPTTDLVTEWSFNGSDLQSVSVTATSSDTSVVTVDTNTATYGSTTPNSDTKTVKAVGTGTATITVTVKYTYGTNEETGYNYVTNTTTSDGTYTYSVSYEVPITVTETTNSTL